MGFKHIVFTPDRNVTGNDFKGAFEPEGNRYADFWRSQGDEVVIHRIDVSKKATERAAATIALIEAAAPVDRVVFLCHGWKTGVQFGIEKTLSDFARRLAVVSTDNLKITLYCCGTGASAHPRGEGSFADKLCDALSAAGRANVSVFSHTTAGHTTRNAYVRFFFGRGNPAGSDGGEDAVKPKSIPSRKFYLRLHDGKDSFRFRVPYMTVEEIAAELV